jgi:hypothetical protein
MNHHMGVSHESKVIQIVIAAKQFNIMRNHVILQLEFRTTEINDRYIVESAEENHTQNGIMIREEQMLKRL